MIYYQEFIMITKSCYYGYLLSTMATFRLVYYDHLLSTLAITFSLLWLTLAYYGFLLSTMAIFL